MFSPLCSCECNLFCQTSHFCSTWNLCFIGVVVIDDQPEVSIDDPAFLFENNEGFQEVTSRKTQKSKQKAAQEEANKKMQEQQQQQQALAAAMAAQAKKSEKEAKVCGE